MKKFTLLLALMLAVSMLAGCAGTPVIYYTDCTCPAAEAAAAPEVPAAPAETQPAAAPVEGALKTGLHIATSVGKSASATAEAAGTADYDVTMVAVLVDDEGVIQDCIIDSIGTQIAFDGTGVIQTKLDVAPQTKNELGENYNMKAYGQAIAEWDEQAAAFAAYVVGKTVEEVEGIAVDEETRPTDADLTSSVTIKVGSYIEVIKAAVANAKHLGAQGGDVLKMATNAAFSKDSKDAAAEAAGNAQLDVDVMVLTMNGETITSAAIDSVQAKVAFDATGTITSDVTVPVQTKNELGENYNMVAWGGAIAEWDAQAASFCQYITGKTAAEVSGIAVNESTKPTDADLATSVTIAIGGFQALVAKAAQ